MAKDFVKHKLIKENTIQARAYQANILATAMKKNTLCVLPTGLGKTPVSVLLAVKRLEEYPESKILVLAPTRPLVNQHYDFFLKTLDIEEERFAILTGMVKPELRGRVYEEKQIIFATPQTIKNDLVEKRLSLKEFSLLVLDETHHAIGEYAYPYIAKKYKESADHQRILGLTASPGGTRQKIKEICKNIGIEAVEVRTEIDEDVTPWVKKKEMQWVYVELPESFKKIRSIVNEEYTKKLNALKKFGFLRGRRVSKKDLLSLQNRLYQGIKEGEKKSILGMSFVTQAIKLEHVLTLLETQGIRVLEKYWKKLRDGKSKSNERLVKNKNISNAIWLTHSLFEQGSKHPKIGKLCSIVNQQFRWKKDSKIIVFANYRESVKEIVSSLRNVDNAKPVEFVGQREGMTQKEQKRRLDEFKSGEHNVLVTTSIGEEGIHVAEADIAIFYEPVPSEIRHVQRRGRVGRTSVGKIIILITKNTRDETYQWIATRKEKVMKRTLYGMGSESGVTPKKSRKKQADLSDFT